MPAENQSDKNTPHHEAPPPHHQKKTSQRNLQRDVPAIHEKIDWIGHQILGVILVPREMAKLGIPIEDPADMSPPESPPRVMGIQFAIGMSMVNPMSGYPGDRTPLDREGAAQGEKVLDPAW